MIDLEVDMGYLLDELDGVVLVDENGEMPDMVFVPQRTCRAVPMDCFGNHPFNNTGLHGNDTSFGCSECGYPWANLNFGKSLLQCKINAFPRFCPNCGAKVAY